MDAGEAAEVGFDGFLEFLDLCSGGMRACHVLGWFGLKGIPEGGNSGCHDDWSWCGSCDWSLVWWSTMVLRLDHLVVDGGALGAACNACNGGAMVVLWLEPLLVLLVLVVAVDLAINIR